MSFSNRRQQACLLAALTRLERGQSVAQMAIELRQRIYRRIWAHTRAC